MRANWKLLFENYSECYHCAPVHPSLARVTPPTSGENDLVEGPVTGGFMTINDGYESLTLSGRACGVPVGDLPADDRRRVYYYAIFPNLFLSLHPDYVMAHTLWPVAPDRTRIVCTWLFSPRTLEDPSLDPNDGVAFRKGLPPETVQKIRQALLKISSTDAGKKLFEEAIGTQGVAETNL